MGSRTGGADTAKIRAIASPKPVPLLHTLDRRDGQPKIQDEGENAGLRHACGTFR
jgi:hypothetical protein